MKRANGVANQEILKIPNNLISFYNSADSSDNSPTPTPGLLTLSPKYDAFTGLRSKAKEKSEMMKVLMRNTQTFNSESLAGLLTDPLINKPT